MALFGSIGEFQDSREPWTQYIQRMEQFFAANDIEEAKKAPVFLATIGPKVFQTLSNLVAPCKPGEVTYTRSVELMSEFYNPKPLVTVQRYRFYSRFKKPDESISTFVAELCNLARDCAFGTTLETNLRNQLVCGIGDQALQRKLLSEKDLTYERALEIALSHESATKNVAALHSSSSSTGETLYQVEGSATRSSSSSSTTCYRCG